MCCCAGRARAHHECSMRERAGGKREKRERAKTRSIQLSSNVVARGAFPPRDSLLSRATGEFSDNI